MPDDCVCHQEVARLHQFFQDWYCGVLGEERFETCERALAADFAIVTPSGQLIERDQILRAIRSHRGGEPPDFRIVTVSRQCRQVDGVHISTYEEHQRGSRSTMRLSTAVLGENGGVWTWHNVHETWITTADL